VANLDRETKYRAIVGYGVRIARRALRRKTVRKRANRRIDPVSEIDKRLAELGVVLPKPAAPVANYVPFVRTGGMAPGALPMLFISGQLPLGPDGKLDERHKGKLGPDSPIDAAREAAERCAINILAQARAALGDLDKVVRVVRLGGFFSVVSQFDALPQAMNGASDLMAKVFGERGLHARTTVGVAHLPLNALAEVEALFEISF
jgi:enamine deaminase RidA (YjgF/YER057c/UK114 family)